MSQGSTPYGCRRDSRVQLLAMSNREMRKPSRRKRIAYHEAGHAVVAHYLGIRLGRKGISLVAEQCFFPRHTDNDTIGNCVRVALAGAEAQRRLHPKIDVELWEDETDREEVSEALQVAYPNRWSLQIKAWERLRYQVEALLKEPEVWAAVKAVARELLRQGRLTPAQARKIIEPRVAFASAIR